MKKQKYKSQERKATRPHIVQFRLTAADYEHLKREAEQARVVPNECARRKTLAEAMLLRQTTELPFAVTHELGCIGNNLNQIARRLHMSDRYEPEALTQACERLNELLRVILMACGV